jgi:hypothetical protein
MDLGNLQKSLLLAQRASQAIDSAAGLSAEDKTAIAIAVNRGHGRGGCQGGGAGERRPLPSGRRSLGSAGGGRSRRLRGAASPPAAARSELNRTSLAISPLRSLLGLPAAKRAACSTCAHALLAAQDFLQNYFSEKEWKHIEDRSVKIRKGVRLLACLPGLTSVSASFGFLPFCSRTCGRAGRRNNGRPHFLGLLARTPRRSTPPGSRCSPHV